MTLTERIARIESAFEVYESAIGRSAAPGAFAFVADAAEVAQVQVERLRV
ncbi:hypothetical protein [Mesorhizobium sp. M0643]